MKFQIQHTMSSMILLNIKNTFCPCIDPNHFIINHYTQFTIKKQTTRLHNNTIHPYEFTLLLLPEELREITTNINITPGQWATGITALNINTSQVVEKRGDLDIFKKWFTSQIVDSDAIENQEVVNVEVGDIYPSPYNNGIIKPNDNYSFTIFTHDVTVGQWSSGGFSFLAF